MPLYRSRFFDGIIELRDSASEAEIRALLNKPDVQRIQAVGPVELDTWMMLNDRFF